MQDSNMKDFDDDDIVEVDSQSFTDTDISSNDNTIKDDENTTSTDASVSCTDKNSDDMQSSKDVSDKKKSKNKEKKTKKVKTPYEKKKQKKIAIIVTSVILALAIIITAIAVPVANANKDKIFVNSKSDFNKDNGKFFVLTKDLEIKDNLTLNEISKFDLNGHTLDIKGDLIIDNDKNVELFNNNKSEGVIQVNNIVINTTKNVNISTTIKCNSISISANAISLNSPMSINHSPIKEGKTTRKAESILTANNIHISSKIQFNNPDNDNKLTFLNSKSVIIDNTLIGSIKVTSTDDIVSQVKVNASLVGDIYGDELSSIIIGARVDGKIDKFGANKVGIVTLLDNSSVKELFNVDNVYIHQNLVAPNMTDVNNINIIRQLERPKYVKVNTNDGILELEFGAVLGADKYRIVIDENRDSKVVMVSPTNKVDITKYIADSNKHIITVQALSDNPLFLESKTQIYEYMVDINLLRPQNIVVEKVEIENPAFDKENREQSIRNGIDEFLYEYKLSFDKVNFAERYIIKINGNKIPNQIINENIDITEYVSNGGAYQISVQAVNANENIKDSKIGIYEFKNIVPLGNMNLKITNDNENIYVDYSKSNLENVLYYEIKIDLFGYDKTIVYRTADSKIELPRISGSQVIKDGTTFTVTAVSNNPYFTDVTISGIYDEIIR